VSFLFSIDKSFYYWLAALRDYVIILKGLKLFLLVNNVNRVTLLEVTHPFLILQDLKTYNVTVQGSILVRSSQN
jgi:hypothetical protein